MVSIKLFYSNLHSYNNDNFSIKDIINEIKNIKPDIIVFVEYSSKKMLELNNFLLLQGWTYEPKSMNLVAYKSKEGLKLDKSAVTKVKENPKFLDGRFLPVVINDDLKVINTYVPPINDKINMDFDKQIKERIEPYRKGILELAEEYRNEKVIIVGDFNPFNPEDNKNMEYIAKGGILTDCKQRLENLGYKSIVNVPTRSKKQLDFVFFSKILLESIYDISINVKKVKYSDHKTILIDF